MATGWARTKSAPRELLAGTITGLKSKGPGGERIGVHLDGKHAFDLSATVAIEADLRKDEFLSEERQVALLQKDEPFRARESALGMLARRELCGGEVTSRLLRAGISESAALDALRWLEERGYVDDRRYAGMYAADRLKAGWGRRRIVAELLRKGVAREVLAGQAWDGLLEQEGLQDGLEQVVPLVRRRFAGQLRSDPDGAKQRISGFLARRGHDWETISAVLKVVADGVDDEERLEP